MDDLGCAGNHVLSCHCFRFLLLFFRFLQGYLKDSNAAAHSVDSYIFYIVINVSARFKSYIITFISYSSAKLWCPRQRNIYQITSPRTCNLHIDKQTNFVWTAFSSRLSFTLVRTANSPRLLYLATSWLVTRRFLGGELVGGEMPGYRDKGSRQ